MLKSKFANGEISMNFKKNSNFLLKKAFPQNGKNLDDRSPIEQKSTNPIHKEEENFTENSTKQAKEEIIQPKPEKKKKRKRK